MPHRALNIDEVAKFLHLARRDVEMLVKRAEIPFDRQGERIVFRRSQVEGWASQRILGLQGSSLSAYHRSSSAQARATSSDQALMAGMIRPVWIDPALPSRTKPSVLRDMVALAEKTELVSDPKDLLASLEAREALCSTAMDGGVALLHPRHHEPFVLLDSFLVLGRAVQPVFAGAPDGKPTDFFFLICCQEDRLHLHTLARLCTMCHRTTLLENLRAAPGAEEMQDALVRSEEEVMRGLA
jgi:nitrogen PTS system EIIA component